MRIACFLAGMLAGAALYRYLDEVSTAFIYVGVIDAPEGT